MIIRISHFSYLLRIAVRIVYLLCAHYLIYLQLQCLYTSLQHSYRCSIDICYVRAENKIHFQIFGSNEWFSLDNWLYSSACTYSFASNQSLSRNWKFFFLLVLLMFLFAYFYCVELKQYLYCLVFIYNLN